MNIQKSISPFALTLLLLLASPVAFADAVVVPVPGPVKAGGIFTISVQIAGPTVAGVPTGVDNLYAYQFDLSYPSNLVEALVVKDGGFLAGGGRTSFSKGLINNATGTVSNISETLFGSASGVSGSGTLVNITFQAIASGTPQITISNITLIDSHLSPIIIDDTPAQVSTSVPVTLSAARRPQHPGGTLLALAPASPGRSLQPRPEPQTFQLKPNFVYPCGLRKLASASFRHSSPRKLPCPVQRS